VPGSDVRHAWPAVMQGVRREILMSSTAQALQPPSQCMNGDRASLRLEQLIGAGN